MKTLLLLRHAKSSWSHNAGGDHGRPLSGRGGRAAPMMGQLILEQELVPDVVVSSTARRAIDTAQLVTESCGFSDTVQTTDELYNASTAEWLSVLCDLPDEADRALVIGHNPGIEDLLLLLGGEHHRMSTAALAHVQLPIDNWFDVTLIPRATLVDLWRPRDLDPENHGR